MDAAYGCYVASSSVSGEWVMVMQGGECKMLGQGGRMERSRGNRIAG